MKLKHFREDEFKCKCGCGMDVHLSLKILADAAREESGVKYVISSGARCKKHNEDEGGKPTSSHLKGMAIDIKYRNFLHMVWIIFGLVRAGFKRIGINRKLKFIHADIDTEKDRAIWEYR